MPANRSTLAPTSPVTRSRVSNGTAAYLGDVDGRSAEARRFKDVLAEILADLGGEPTAAQRNMARRAAALTVRLERLEADDAAGRDIDLNDYVRLLNAHGRTLERLGGPPPRRRAESFADLVEAEAKTGDQSTTTDDPENQR